MTEQDRDAIEHVRTVVRGAGSSFYWAMKLLPADKRNAMFAIYAFCREVDDIADEPAPRDDKLARLDAWRDELDAIYAGRPQHVIARALAEPVSRYDLQRTDFDAIIDGVEMDAKAAIRAPALAELELYCARVAGAVGQHSIRIFGCTDPRAAAFATATGEALQLTNILRDVDEDATRGRLYLPREMLTEAGIEEDDPSRVLHHPALSKACAAVAARAEARYAEAEQLRRAMSASNAAALRPAVMMSAIYRRLLDLLTARGWSRVDQPVRVGKVEKLWLATRIAIAG
ncbi:MAG: presqualene diphosphate synthase HpnD [Alphaproteobacteria bacterium]